MQTGLNFAATQNGDMKKQTLTIEYRDTRSLVPYAMNARTHSEDQVAEIMASIRKFGFTNPVLVDENGGIIAGHGRTLAAARLNMIQVPTITLAHLTEDEKRAYIIADNKLATKAGWDMDLLSQELEYLASQGFDLELTGFQEAELHAILHSDEDPPEPADRETGSGPGTQDPDKEKSPVVTVELREEVRAEMVKKWDVREGQVWQLGDHRIICGDSTKRETYQALMGNEKAALVFTDPPYGVSYKDAQGDSINSDTLANDQLSTFLLDTFRNLYDFTKDTAAFYIWHASSTRKDFEHAMTAVALVEKQYLMWVKDTFVLGWSDYLWQTEPCFYAQKDGHTADFYGARNNSNVWRITNIDREAASIQIATGLLISDGNGNTLFVQSKPPKNKKMRHVRIGGAAAETISLSAGEQSDAWQISRDPIGEYLHPTQKPVELALKGVENSSKPGEIVLDAFAGAGFTLLACELAGRKCRTIDNDPQFVAVVIERWHQSTGKIPVLKA